MPIETAAFRPRASDRIFGRLFFALKGTGSLGRGLFFLAAMVLLAGCAARGGLEVYAPPLNDPGLRDFAIRLNALGETLGYKPGNKYWHIGFVRTSIWNAWSFGEGLLAFSDGLRTVSGDWKDGIVAHEMAHDYAGHADAQRTASVATTAAFTVLGVFVPGAGLINWAANPLVVRSYGRGAELEADRIGAWMLIGAYGEEGGRRRIQGLISFMSTLPDKGNEGSLMDTHPAKADRIKQLRGILAGEIELKAPEKPPE